LAKLEAVRASKAVAISKPSLIRFSLLGATMIMPASPSLTRARRRALTVLAGESEGCTEAVMMAHGFALEFLADLVADGLVSERTDRVEMGKRSIEVVRLCITDVGRAVLAI
jgi:hypothetical protein